MRIKRVLVSLFVAVGLLVPTLFTTSVAKADDVPLDTPPPCSTESTYFYVWNKWPLLDSNGNERPDIGRLETYWGYTSGGLYTYCAAVNSGTTTRGISKYMSIKVGTYNPLFPETIQWTSFSEGYYPGHTEDGLVTPGPNRCVALHGRIQYNGNWYHLLSRSGMCGGSADPTVFDNS